MKKILGCFLLVLLIVAIVVKITPESPNISTIGIKEDIKVGEDLSSVIYGNLEISPVTEVHEDSDVNDKKSSLNLIGKNYVYSCFSAKEFADFLAGIDRNIYEVVQCVIPKESNGKALIIYTKIQTNQNARS